MPQRETAGTDPGYAHRKLVKALAAGLATLVALGLPWGLAAQETGEPPSPSSLQRLRELTQPRPAPTPGQTPAAGSTCGTF